MQQYYANACATVASSPDPADDISPVTSLRGDEFVANRLKAKLCNLGLFLKDNTHLQNQAVSSLSSLSSKNRITGSTIEDGAFLGGVPAKRVLLFRAHFEIRVLEFGFNYCLIEIRTFRIEGLNFEFNDHVV
jgi:hypothetical protein